MSDKTHFKYLKTKHSYHLVDPSPWPLVASLGAFFMTFGTVLYMNKFLDGGQLALIGFFIILYVMYTWWRDIIREATFEEQHTVSVQRGLRLGMILFIVSEIMFFFLPFLEHFFTLAYHLFIKLRRSLTFRSNRNYLNFSNSLNEYILSFKFWCNWNVSVPCNKSKSKKNKQLSGYFLPTCIYLNDALHLH